MSDLSEHYDAEVMMDDLNEFWADLLTSMLSLFKCISDGADWHYVVRPLQLIHWGWYA